MKDPTRLSNKTSSAWSCAEDQILENKNLRNMILNICAGREAKHFREIYLPVWEHIWLIGSGGITRLKSWLVRISPRHLTSTSHELYIRRMSHKSHELYIRRMSHVSHELCIRRMSHVSHELYSAAQRAHLDIWLVRIFTGTQRRRAESSRNSRKSAV